MEDTHEGKQANINKAIIAAQAVIDKGHLPFIPQSMFAFWEDDGYDMKKIMETCFAWIKECDAVLVLNIGSEGGGTWSAREVAREAGLKIFESLDQID